MIYANAGDSPRRGVAFLIKAVDMSEFHNTIKWRKKRATILKRDKYQCVECRKYGRSIEAKVVHHFKSVEDYPELALVDDNLASLCNKCHAFFHPEKGTKSLKYQRK
jgi:5-methylcytosine-specific restriction endonuclease McrA